MADKKIYGIADKAWQCVIGCDPHMPCAPRCWARKTVARIVECQKPENPERAAVYQIALTPDGKQWSGETFLDLAHLKDPLHWRASAVVATGFHGDIGRLALADMLLIFQQIGKCPRHTFMLLTKQPQDLLAFLRPRRWRCFNSQPQSLDGTVWVALIPGEHREDDPGALPNVSIGCSVMNQPEADRQREPMAQIAAMGWATHVWYEPAIGPVDWRGWEFLRGVIVGFESGKNSRPGHPAWARSTRDWCVANSVPFHFKQWGDWMPSESVSIMRKHALALADGTVKLCKGWNEATAAPREQRLERVGKAESGRLLDGREWNEVPEVRA